LRLDIVRARLDDAVGPAGDRKGCALSPIGAIFVFSAPGNRLPGDLQRRAKPCTHPSATRLVKRNGLTIRLSPVEYLIVFKHFPARVKYCTRGY
jgi:hypothetical protein